MKPVTLIAISVFFSAWGDRLWTFAVGLYLVKLTPGSLQLTAIYGLVLTSTAFMFSPLIGNWIDRQNRLKAVRLLLILQNTFVFIDGIIILIYLFDKDSPKYVLQIMQTLIILFGSLANLAGQGEKISITKDWLVVICRKDGKRLAKANTLLRQIDLSVAIIAPVGVGFLMSVISDLAGIVFICSWNIITMIVEYLLLLRVYKGDVELHKLPTAPKETSDVTENIDNHVNVGFENADHTSDDETMSTDGRTNVNSPNTSEELSLDKSDVKNESKENKLEGTTDTDMTNSDNDTGIDSIDASLKSDDITSPKDSVIDDTSNAIVKPNDTNITVPSVDIPRPRSLTLSSSQLKKHSKIRLVKFFNGWKVYKKQPVFLSGLALAVLYVTVLGFNAITSSYAYSQGLAEIYVSICFGFGSLVGISGTFLFPIIRKKVGLFRSAIIGNVLQITFLALCVISIWLPGSPSDLHKGNTNATNLQGIMGNINGTTTIRPIPKKTEKFNNISIIVLMVGIILSRAGLWVVDLSVTQIQQEYVSAGERGAVGGGQYAFNSLFDLLHFIITIFLPYPRQFWILILMSTFAVFVSFLINLLAFLTIPQKLVELERPVETS